MLSFLVLLMVLPLHYASAGNVFDAPLILSAAPPDFLSTVQQLKKVRLLRAEFEQRKTLRVLSRPFIARGHMLLNVDRGGVYWQINSPVQSAYRIGTQGIETVSAVNAAIALPMSEAIGRMFTAILSADMDVLEKIFELYYQSQADSWQIGLKPKRKEMQQFISSITFSGKHYIQHIEIREQQGDSTDIYFSKLSEQPAVLSELEATYFFDDQ